MQLTELDYQLSPERIAQKPLEPRDSSRLLVCDRAAGSFSHRHFYDLTDELADGDLLIANDTQVLNARIHGRKPTGGKAEILLLRRIDALRWEALVGGRGVREIEIADGLRASVALTDAQRDGGGHSPSRIVTFSAPIEPYLDTVGESPLPPYIRERAHDPSRYQTVYARVAGSAAAPTAGLHFTPGLLDRLRAKGVGVAFVTLHVGLDTFKPIESETVEAHKIHSEWCQLPQATADAINATRARGGRVIAVGTTSLRVLESARLFIAAGQPLRAYAGDTTLFITPGFKFEVVDALITNFHLPKSSLLALVGGLMGMPLMRAAYAEAIAQGYRFYSFGDAMLIK
jgi:S-adenosylmethionine:tRNA ribosyltransferase-isomerase